MQLPRGLSVRLAAQARLRGIEMEAAACTLIDERLRDLEDASALDAARRWQSQQARSTLDRLRAGDDAEASEAEIEAEFDAALRGAGARPA